MDFERLDRIVKLLEVTETEDLVTFSPVETIVEHEDWAELKELKAKENFELNREADVGLATMFLRYRADVQAFWKVKDDLGRIWRIVGEPRVFGRCEGLELSLELNRS